MLKVGITLKRKRFKEQGERCRETRGTRHKEQGKRKKDQEERLGNRFSYSVYQASEHARDFSYVANKFIG